MTEQGARKRRIARRVIDWLRAGYPAGVPRKDYVALLGILRRRLTAEEIESIAADLAGMTAADQPVSEREIVSAIRSRTRQYPDEDDIRRVRSHLALEGWSVASLDQSVDGTDFPADDDPDDT